MPDEIRLPSGWKQPIGYSNGIVAPAGRIVFLNRLIGTA
jgi:hypothetical protein